MSTMQVTAAQRAALGVLGRFRNYGLTAGGVAERLGHSHASNVARALDRLVEAGILSTFSDSRGKRRWVLTDEGAAWLDSQQSVEG